MSAIHSPDSSIFGYLAPLDTTLDDDNLDDFIHDFIQGITSLDTAAIRPQWQRIPANSPDIATNWISFGVVDRVDDFMPSYSFDPIIGMTISRNQLLKVQLSFIGPLCNSIQAIFRDGITIEQNRDILTASGFSVHKLSSPMNANLLINERWQKRTDQYITFRRAISRIYPIKDLVSATAEVITSTSQHISINT